MPIPLLHGGKPAAVRTLVEDMRSSTNHIICGMGIQDQYDKVDFKKIFTDEMGIPAEWVFSVSSKKSDIRKAFELFSKSAVAVSKSSAAFASAATGGGFAASTAGSQSQSASSFLLPGMSKAPNFGP